MTLFLLQQWKKQKNGVRDAKAFLLTLESETASVHDKELVIRALDDWEVLTPTWFEVADYLPVIERLYENPSFPERERAALLASKVAFCLCDYVGALHLALSAGALFDLTPRTCPATIGPQDEQYVNKMIEQALDTYKTAKRGAATVDKRLETLIDRIFERNLQRREFRYVIGLGLDTRRVDMIERAVKESDDATTLLSETVAKVLESVVERVFRGVVLDVLLRLFGELDEPDFVSMCQCLIKLEKPTDVAEILNRLATSKIAFDLYENASQQFIAKIERALHPERGIAANDGETGGHKDEASANVADSDSSSATTAQGGASETSVDAAKVSSSALSSSSTTSETDSRLRSILSGEQTIRLHMQFLIKNNHTDMLVLKQLKESVRTASAHNATVIANGLMHCGTTCDDFLRDNLDWISKATNWNKFNAVATLGLIHKGHEGNAMKLLEPYLPKGEADPFGFKEGGSLYALGLVHANHGNPTVVAYLKDQLSKATASAVRHGACLGLGLAAMGSHDDTVYKQLRDCLYQDDAVVGEAAGLAMGLVMVASLHEGAFDEMCQYVCDTQHDKIQRGLRTGLALLAYGRMEEVETWVARLLEHKSNPMLRQTGVCLLAMAYAGSGNASVVRRLLAKVAADPNADVKRFAVIAVGFVLSNDPEQCLNYTAMLGEHFNGHVRYGAAMAVGIACAGSGYKEAIALLEPMLAAKENFVRQGAVIALSFVLIQQTEATCPKVSEFRRTLAKMVGEKGEDSITKFGAILAQGLIDAGGRNVTISLHNRTGHADMPGVVGTFVFLQHWYWHSLAHFVSLAFRPSCVIGLNKNLDMPKMEFRSNAKPSMFAYPPALEEKKKEESEKVETAVLSITNKKRLPPVATPATPSSTIPTTPIEDMDVDNAASLPRVDDQPRKEMEAAFVLLANPARVLRLQLKCLTMPENCRYKPLKPLAQGGVILMRDRRGDQVEEVVATVVGGGGSAAGAAVSDVEAQPPAAFEYVIANY